MPDEHGVRMYELCAWGRRYQSQDGLFRELRLPRFGTVEGAQREPGEVAMAARVLACGSRARTAEEKGTGALRLAQEAGASLPGAAGDAANPGYASSRSAAATAAPGCSSRVTRTRPCACTRRRPESRLRGTVDATERRPGRSCASCRLASSCLDLGKVPGLLGVADVTRPRRTVSVTDLRRHDKCPAQEHLRRLRLPRRLDIEYGSRAVQRGKAVHELLEQLHARTPHRPCILADVPDGPGMERRGVAPDRS